MDITGKVESKPPGLAGGFDFIFYLFLIFNLSSNTLIEAKATITTTRIKKEFINALGNKLDMYDRNPTITKIPNIER